MKKNLVYLLLVIFITSCGSQFSLQKRKYRKGFYFASKNNKASKDRHDEALNKSKNYEVEPRPETVKVEGKIESTETIIKNESQIASEKILVQSRVKAFKPNQHNRFVQISSSARKENHSNKAFKKNLSKKTKFIYTPAAVLGVLLQLLFAIWVFKDGFATGILRLMCVLLLELGVVFLLLGLFASVASDPLALTFLLVALLFIVSGVLALQKIQ